MKTKILFKNTVLFFVLILFASINFDCNAQDKKILDRRPREEDYFKEVQTGADRIYSHRYLLKDKKVGVLTNQTGIIHSGISGPSARGINNQFTKLNPSVMIDEQLLIDFLIENKINIKKIYAPEHGFRGTADAGELIKDSKDTKTSLTIITLYGNNNKPTKEQLAGIDVMLFDLQDVGARFYTYISSLHYLMEACAENNIPIIVLDRPNPKGATIDGPVLKMEHTSFVGMHPVPVLHGMTIGEYAKMINGEKWLKNGIEADLTVIPVKNYNKSIFYSLPVKPSPNLPNDLSINLYTSLCFFEGTNVSVGRGTEKQFQIYGSPFLKNMDFTFTPQPNEGAKDPMHNGKKCYGEDLSDHEFVNGLSLQWLIKAYQNTSDKSKFFNNFFVKLAGTQKLRQQIEQGLSEKEIRKSWQTDLDRFKKTREKYLLYSDF